MSHSCTYPVDQIDGQYELGEIKTPAQCLVVGDRLQFANE